MRAQQPLSQRPELLVRNATGVLDGQSVERFAPSLLDALRGVVTDDRGVLYVFRRSGSPWLLFDESDGDSTVALTGRSYLSGGYLDDPYYRAFLKGLPEGLYTLPDVWGQGLESNDPRGWQGAEHVTYLAPVSDDACVVLLLLRENTTPFLPEEVESYRALQSAVCPALRSHWSSAALDETGRRIAATNDLYIRVQRALDVYGDGVLTPREAAVVRLLMRGYSAKAAGTKLGIATATAALHRKRAYAKLGVCSQAQLFNHFLSSLAS
jgi:DNA-binding CsgD family transcriptional regulator